MSYINFLSNEGSIPKVDPQSYRPVDSHVWSLSTDQKLWVRRSVDNNPTLADHLQDEECSSSQWQRFTLREGNTITFKKAVLWQENEIEGGKQWVFLQDKVFRNIRTYHTVKAGTIHPKKEVVPSNWEKRSDQGEIYQISQEQVDEVFESRQEQGVSSSSREKHVPLPSEPQGLEVEGEQAQQRQEESLNRSLEVETAPAPSMVLTRSQKAGSVPQEVKEAIQDQSFKNKVQALEKELVKTKKLLSHEKQHSEAAQGDYLKEHEAKNAAEEKSKAAIKENKALKKSIEAQEAEIRTLKLRLSEVSRHR